MSTGARATCLGGSFFEVCHKRSAVAMMTLNKPNIVNAIRNIFELGSPTSGAEIWLRKGRA